MDAVRLVCSIRCAGDNVGELVSFLRSGRQCLTVAEYSGMEAVNVKNHGKMALLT